MPDVRKLYDDKDLLGAFDLDGRDVTVTIESIEGGVLKGADGKSNKKPIIRFKGKKKGYAVPITVARVIAAMYGGFKSELWIGRRVTLYPTTCDAFGKTVDCIRVRNKIPPDGKADDAPDPVEAPTEPSAVTA